MGAIQAGKKCIKLSGRHAGEVVTVVKQVDANFVEVKDKKGKAKRCNVKHLEPMR